MVQRNDARLIQRCRRRGADERMMRRQHITGRGLQQRLIADRNPMLGDRPRDSNDDRNGGKHDGQHDEQIDGPDPPPTSAHRRSFTFGHTHTQFIQGRRVLSEPRRCGADACCDRIGLQPISAMSTGCRRCCDSFAAAAMRKAARASWWLAGAVRVPTITSAKTAISDS